MKFKFCSLGQPVVFTVLFFFPLAFLASPSAVMSPLSAEVVRNWNGLELMGQTSLTRFGFHIYDASFWMASDRSEDSYSSSLSALSITYAKNIRAEKLLSSTKKEWTKLGIAKKHPVGTWLAELRTMWPDVSKGDQIIFVFDPDGSSTFFSQEKKLGSIDDPEFGPAFLSIWLSEKSRFTKNRNELLGKT